MLKREILLSGDKLKARALELGVSTTKDKAAHDNVSDAELQRRVLEAERSIRENRLWIVALLSALASIISAIAAWRAVLLGHPHP